MKKLFSKQLMVLPQVQRGPKGLSAHPAPLVQLAHQDLLAPLARKGLRVYRVCRGRRVPLVPPALRVRKGLRVYRATQAPPARKDRQAPLVRQAPRVLLAR